MSSWFFNIASIFKPKKTSTTTPGAKSKRLRVVGKNIAKPDGTFVILRGYNQGHGEVANDTDSIEDAAAGANAVRIIWRKWGPYQRIAGTTLDGQKTGAPGDMDEAYMAYIVKRVQQAKAAGLYVILAGDSNCGQNGKQGSTDDPPDMSTYNFCVGTDGLPGSNFYVPGGQAQKQLFYQTWDWFSKKLYGLVDIYEPLVEPSADEGSIASTQAIQQDIRNIILKNDPEAIICIGGYSAYEMPAMKTAPIQAWIDAGNTILTADMLDNSVTGTTTAAKVQAAIDCRNQWNCPVYINQIGSRTSTDPGDVKLMAAFGYLRDAAGGSIHWTLWEKVSASLNSYGPYKDNGTGGRVLSSQGRVDNMHTAFVDTKIIVP